MDSPQNLETIQGEEKKDVKKKRTEESSRELLFSEAATTRLAATLSRFLSCDREFAI